VTATDEQFVKTELDCWHEHYAICPWCGYEDHDSWEYQEGVTDAECPNCGKPITVTTEVEVTYTTKPMGGWPDDCDR